MWAQVINALLGLWLMIAPALLNVDKTIANNDHIIGPLIVSFSVIAWWEATRVVRFYNLPFSLWLLVAPWVLGYDHTLATINDMAVGALVSILVFVKGDIEEKFGGGWAAIWQKNPLHIREAREKQE